MSEEKFCDCCCKDSGPFLKCSNEKCFGGYDLVCSKCTGECISCEKIYCDCCITMEESERKDDPFPDMCRICEEKNTGKCGICFEKPDYLYKCGCCARKVCYECRFTCSSEYCEGGWTGQSTTSARCCRKCLKECKQCGSHYCSGCFGGDEDKKDKDTCYECHVDIEEGNRTKRPFILEVVRENKKQVLKSYDSRKRKREEEQKPNKKRKIDSKSEEFLKKLENKYC